MARTHQAYSAQAMYAISASWLYIVNAGDLHWRQRFRKDKHTEAAFQFADEADAYAAHRAAMYANIGVIVFAAFALQGSNKYATALFRRLLLSRRTTTVCAAALPQIKPGNVKYAL